PRFAEVQVQVPVQPRRRQIRWRVITANVIEVFPVSLIASAHKTQVRPAQRQRDAIILLIEQGASLDCQSAVPANRLAHLKSLIAGGEALLLPPIFAELPLVALDRNPPNGRGDGKCRLALRLGPLD